jgi:SPFH domain / Band 7 family
MHRAAAAATSAAVLTSSRRIATTSTTTRTATGRTIVSFTAATATAGTLQIPTANYHKNNNISLSSTSSSSFSRRHLSYVLDGWGSGGGRGGGFAGAGGGGWQWPITKRNTVFNIVPQGHKYVVERFGKLHSVEESGWFLAIPMVDQIAYVIDVRERAMDIPPQSAITRDNVSVEVSGNLFVKFQDPVAAAYGAFNPLYSVTQVRKQRYNSF